MLKTEKKVEIKWRVTETGNSYTEKQYWKTTAKH